MWTDSVDNHLTDSFRLDVIRLPSVTRDESVQSAENERERTYDALLEVLVKAVIADLLQQQRMELLKRFEVLEVSVDHVQVFAGAICRPALYKQLYALSAIIIRFI